MGAIRSAVLIGFRHVTDGQCDKHIRAVANTTLAQRRTGKNATEIEPVASPPQKTSLNEAAA